MAEAEDDKTGKRRKALYDHSSAKPKGEDANKPKGKSETSADLDMAAGTKDAAKGGGKEKPKEENPRAEVRERHKKDREALRKSHESQRRDMHGNHREEHRKMAARHEQDQADLAKKHEAELAAVETPGAMDANDPSGPAGPVAGGGQAQTAVPAAPVGGAPGQGG